MRYQLLHHRKYAMLKQHSLDLHMWLVAVFHFLRSIISLLSLYFYMLRTSVFQGMFLRSNARRVKRPHKACENVEKVH